jgi:hypothetical protein
VDPPSRESAVDSTGFVKKSAVMAIPEAYEMAHQAGMIGKLVGAGWAEEGLPKLTTLADQLHDFLDFVELAMPRVRAVSPQAEIGLDLLRHRLYRDLDRVQHSLEGNEFTGVSEALDDLARHLEDYTKLGGHVAMALRSAERPPPA